MFYKLIGKKPVFCPDVTEFEKWFGTVSNRLVSVDDIGDVRVSTVFLGIDHNFGSSGEPILFETMVFGGPLDQKQNRYFTYEEAENGHKEMLEKVISATSSISKSDLIVICIDNEGLEDCFDLQVEYIAQHSDFNDSYLVENKFGKKQNLLKSRFEVKNEE